MTADKLVDILFPDGDLSLYELNNFKEKFKSLEAKTENKNCIVFKNNKLIYGILITDHEVIVSKLYKSPNNYAGTSMRRSYDGYGADEKDLYNFLIND